MRFVAFAFAFLVACSGSSATVDSGVPGCGDLGDTHVTPNDVLGYPPYAMNGCRLAYVDGPTGDLVLRDVSLGTSQVLEPAASMPRRPAMASDVVAWEAQGGVRVFYKDTISTVPVPSGYDHVSEPAAATSIVVVTAWRAAPADADTDVLAFDPASATFSPVIVAPKQQRFAAVSDTIVAVTDFTEDPIGSYTGSGGDLADIGVFTRSSSSYALRQRPGKDAFPAIISNDVLGYLHWGDVHPEPKLEAYTVYSGTIGADPTGDVKIADVTNAFALERPSAKNGVIEWVVTLSGSSTLWRADATGSSPPSAALTVTNQSLLGSVSLDQGTLVAAGNVLRIVAR